MSNADSVKECIRNRKTNLISIFGSKCCICGFNAYQEALEFHHVKAEDKSFSISSRPTISIQEQIEELRKTICVCANCHRGIHGNYIDVPENWQSFFNEEIAQQLLENSYIYGGHKCEVCGKPIHRNAKKCIECSHKDLYRTEHPTREQLKDEIRTTPFTQLGKKYGVTDNAVRKWCKAYNLPSKTSEIRNYSDEEWFEI